MGGILWDQYDNAATEPPINIGSQDFEPAFDTLDDQAADDFVLPVPPPNINLYLTGVRVMGEYSDGGGPASSFNVYFYSNGPGNVPEALIAEFFNLPYTGTPPDFTIRLPDPMGIGSGTYWVSVQARQDFNPKGQWFWHNRTVQSNAGAAWQNPGDGYGTGCITWNRKNTCMPDQVAPDQVFQILGFGEGPTPSPTPTPTPTATPTPRPTPSCSPPCSVAVVFSENFDNLTPPALPPGWIATNALGPPPLWVTSDGGVLPPPYDSPPNAAFIDDPDVVSDKRLDSVPISWPIWDLGTPLTFRHSYNLEASNKDPHVGFDGGVLEISTDGGNTFQDILDVGGTFVKGGYNRTISTDRGSPIGGRQAWSGNSGGFITTAVTLPFITSSVTLRWRMASDISGSSEGWRVDTIYAAWCLPFPCDTPTPTPSATPTVTPTATPTPTLTATPTPTPPPRITPRPRPTPLPRPTPR